MLGNDVVDLEDPETRPETFRPRFDERVFDPTERRAIARDEDAHARRWTHWAAKEAAYKLARQIDPRFVFAPSRLVARFTRAVDAEGDRRLHYGTLALPSALAGGSAELELRAEQTEGRVHVVAIPAGADWDAVVASIRRLEPGDDPSEAVRALARADVARDLGIDASRVGIGRRGRVPTVEIDGRPGPMSLSLSHHGRFLACATTHRVGLEASAAASGLGRATGSA